MGPTLEYERLCGFPKTLVAGVDEVGRGCLAGPVFAAAVVAPQEESFFNTETHPWLLELNDSKLLDAETRERLVPLIESWALGFAVGQASVVEIDQINILQASFLAMRRALDLLPAHARPLHVIVDGKYKPPGFPYRLTAVVQGDSKSISVACASILAKVARDRLMAELDSEFPGYGLAVHKGYFTPQHKKALAELGVSSLHRRSFAPVREIISRSDELKPKLRNHF